MGSLKKKTPVLLSLSGEGGREMVSLSRGEASVVCVSEPVLPACQTLKSLTLLSRAAASVTLHG